MLVDADEVHAPVVLYPLGVRERLVRGDAELVAVPARGDVLVCLGIDVGVDAQGDAGTLAEPGADAVKEIQLRRGLDVEEQNTLPEA